MLSLLYITKVFGKLLKRNYNCCLATEIGRALWAASHFRVLKASHLCLIDIKYNSIIQFLTPIISTEKHFVTFC